jgi:hypothetical protein
LIELDRELSAAGWLERSKTAGRDFLRNNRRTMGARTAVSIGR